MSLSTSRASSARSSARAAIRGTRRRFDTCDQRRALLRTRQRRAPDLWLLVVVLAVSAPFMQGLGPQQGSRYALTAAALDQHTISVSDYSHLLGVDFATHNGDIFSDKAPGQPFLAIPAYGLYRLVGGHNAMWTNSTGDVGLWVVSVWSSAMPAALLAVLMRRFAMQAGASPKSASTAAVAMSLSTMLLPFSTQLFGHIQAAVFGLSSYVVLNRMSVTRRRLVLGGTFAGLGIITEYPLAIVAAVVWLSTIYRHRGRSIWFVLGVAGPVVLLAVYNCRLFDDPLALSYSHGQFGMPEVRPPLVGMGLAVLIGDRGLFTLTPTVALAVVGTLGMLRFNRDHGLDNSAYVSSVLGCVIVVAFVALMASWGNPYGGASPGPRYVIPALPWLAPGLAYCAERYRIPLYACTVVGVLGMLLATVTQPLAPPVENALMFWLQKVANGQFAPTIFDRIIPYPLVRLLVPLCCCAIAGWQLYRAESMKRQAAPPRVSPT